MALGFVMILKTKFWQEAVEMSLVRAISSETVSFGIIEEDRIFEERTTVTGCVDVAWSSNPWKSSMAVKAAAAAP